MFSTDSELDLGIHCPYAVDRQLHKITYPLAINRDEWVVLQNALLQIAVQVRSCVVPGETIGHLREIICPERQKAHVLRDAISTDRRSWQLDHRSDLIPNLLPLSHEDLCRGLVNSFRQHLHFLLGGNQRDHDLRRRAETF